MASGKKKDSKKRNVTITLAIVVVLIGSYMAYSRRNWAATGTNLMEKLYEDEGVTEESHEIRKGRYDSLPGVVKRYFKAVLPDLHDPNHQRSVKTIKSLRLQQTGTFLLNDRWIPFRAEQHVSALMSNIGFLWDATMYLSSPTPQLPGGVGLGIMSAEMPIKVRDAYVKGVGTMEARLLTFLPLLKVEDTKELNEGELMRWLAEAVLIPTALLPGKGGEITWKADKSDPQRAVLQLSDKTHGGWVSLEVKFDNDGLIAEIYGMRSKKVHSDFVSTPWVGYVGSYKKVDGMMIPTRMEAGWKDGDDVDLYFKGEITEFEYGFLDGANIAFDRMFMDE